MDPGRRIGRARAASDEGNAGLAGHLAVGVGHVADPAFLAADDRLDLRRVMQRVEHGEEAFARNGEDSVAALASELLDKDLAAGASRHGRGSSHPAGGAQLALRALRLREDE